MKTSTNIEIKVGDYIKVKRKDEELEFQVYEIGKSYGGNRIFYNSDGGFCMDYEDIEIFEKGKETNI